MSDQKRTGPTAVPNPVNPMAPNPDEINSDDLPLNVIALRGISARDRYGPLLLVLGVAAVGIGLMLIDFRLGTFILAGSVTGALLMRILLPTRRAGLLVVRTRTIDTIVLSVIAGGLLLLALITPATTIPL